MAVVATYGVVHPFAAGAEPMVTSSYNLYGVPGLVEMPTAENAADAEFSGSYSVSGDQRRTTLTFQIAPRLSGSFRYSKIPEIDAGGRDLFDRSFDLRFQFLDETKWLPSMAIGMQDFIGTGVYSGEYLVATKTFWDDVRVTAGLGWGRLGTGDEIARFGDRNTETADTGGTFNVDSYFTGPIAPFGGVSWRANDNLTLKAEYSSDDYVRETRQGVVDHESPWNFAAEYRFNPGVSVTAGYLYGTDVGLQLNFTMNPKSPLLGPGNEEAPLPVKPRPSRRVDPAAWGQEWTTDQADLDGLEKAIDMALDKEGIRLDAIALAGTSAEVRIENQRYLAQTQAIGRTARIMTRALPPSVETVTVTLTKDGVPNNRVSFSRSDLERLENASSEAILSQAVHTDAAGGRPAGMKQVEGNYPRFTWYLAPYLDFSLFDPEDPLRADFGLKLGGEYMVMPGLFASGAIKQKLVGNIDETERSSDSVLPHVRSDFGLYAQATDTYISDLTLAHFARPTTDIYSRVTVGILERMYSGVSGELLWKPVDSRLALGAELNYVVQRDYDGGFGTLDYDVVTGHASAYYEFAQGYGGRVDVGRYLAGDYGATLALDREFANGWRFGAFATKTDVSSEDFGEGSFDKGIYIRIPLAWATGQPSRSTYGTTIRPLTRDGGAKVIVPNRLYRRVKDAHKPQIEASGGRFWR